MAVHVRSRAAVRSFLPLRLLVLAALSLFVAVGCAIHGDPERRGVVSDDATPGPPPAPAVPTHGWRRKHPDGVEIVYRSDLGAYAVVGVNDAYYCDDVFYLWDSGRWLRAPHFMGPWVVVAGSDVPANLARRPASAKGPIHTHDAKD